jgi:hypothetical protein
MSFEFLRLREIWAKGKYPFSTKLVVTHKTSMLRKKPSKVLFLPSRSKSIHLKGGKKK